MPSATPGYAPDLEKYLKSLKGQPLEAAVEKLISCVPNPHYVPRHAHRR